MSAKNGSTRSLRLLGCLMAVALLGSALFASVASAKKTPPTTPTTYINMGDSVSFGYSEEKFDTNYPAEPISAFENNLVNEFAAKVAKKEAKAGNLLTTYNLACPGELSKGMIGDGPLAEHLEEEGEFSEKEAPCGWYNADHFARHYEYGTVSQVEAAAGLIQADEEAGVAVKAVTFQIGSNDELRKLSECASPSYDEAHGFPSFIDCVEYEAEHTLFPTIIKNLGVTVGVLRNAGYNGPVVILGFYNPQTYLVAGSDPLQRELNEAVEATISAGQFGPGVGYANPFKKTNPQQKKGESGEAHEAIERAAICKYTEECNEFDKKVNDEKAVGHAVTAEEAAKYPEGDIHPTPAGDELFAKTIYSAYNKLVKAGV